MKPIEQLRAERDKWKELAEWQAEELARKQKLCVEQADQILKYWRESEALRRELRIEKCDSKRMLAELKEIERNLKSITGMKDSISTMIDALESERNALRKRLQSATMFRIYTGPIYINNVDVMRCEGHRLPKQPYMWKVLSGNGAVLGKDGDWEYEPIPSSRDEEFYARCRFDTYEEAEAAALKALKEEGKDGEVRHS